MPTNAGVNLSRNLGQIFIGCTFGTACWGMACLQMIFYLRTYKLDKWYFRAYVNILLLLATLNQILLIRLLWTSLIPSFGDLTVLASATIAPGFAVTTVIDCLVSFMSQSFFIWRIWRFSNQSWIFPVILFPPAISVFVGGIVLTCETINRDPSITTEPQVQRLALSMAITVAILDILIASIMSVLLRRSSSGFRNSEKLIFRLVYASITTGACTAFFALVSAIGFNWPNDLFICLGSIPTSAVYCNAILANLNSRNHLKPSEVELSGGSKMGYNVSSMEFGTSPLGGVNGESGGGSNQSYDSVNENTVRRVPSRHRTANSGHSDQGAEAH